VDEALKELITGSGSISLAMVSARDLPCGASYVVPSKEGRRRIVNGLSSGEEFEKFSASDPLFPRSEEKTGLSHGRFPL